MNTNFTLIFFADLSLFLPECLLACCILFLIVIKSPAIIQVLKHKTTIYNSSSSGVLVYCLTLFLLLGVLLYFSDVSYSVDSWKLFETSQGIVTLKKFFLILVVLCLPAIIEAAEMAHLRLFDVVLLFLGCVLSSLLIVSTINFISLYLCLEFQALCFYTLAGLARNSIHSSEAGLKYFISSAVTSCLFLAGIFTFYACLGTFDLDQIEIIVSMLISSTAFNYSPFSVLICSGSFFILVTFAFKLVAAPFHFWQPQVYEGAPLCATIIFSVFSKIVIFVPLLRFANCVSSVFPNFYFIFLCLGFITLFVGAYRSYIATRLKSMLIYSSLSQIGLPLSITGFMVLDARIAIFFFLVVYSVTAVFSWNIYTQLVRYQIFSKNFKTLDQYLPIYLSSLRGLWWTNRYIAIKLIFLFFSLSGIPFFIGFLSKSYIYYVLINLNAVMLYALIPFVFINCFSVYYYIRVIKILFEPVNRLPITYTLIDVDSLFIKVINLIDYSIMFFLSVILFFPEPVLSLCTSIALLFFYC